MRPRRRSLASRGPPPLAAVRLLSIARGPAPGKLPFRGTPSSLRLGLPGGASLRWVLMSNVLLKGTVAWENQGSPARMPQPRLLSGQPEFYRQDPPVEAGNASMAAVLK